MDFREFFVSRGWAVYASLIIVILLLPISFKHKLNVIGSLLTCAAVPFIIEFVIRR